MPWSLARQAGVDLAVGGLPFDMLEPGERVCDLAPLTRMKAMCEDGGFDLRVIEARPPLNKAKRGLPGRDEEIDFVCELITNMGKLGIPVWCYEWMAGFARPSRGGSLVTAFRLEDVRADLTDQPPVSPIRGVGRIMRSVDNYQRLLDISGSPMNTITLCQGNCTLVAADACLRVVQTDLMGHEVFYIVAPDTTSDRPSRDLAAEVFPGVPLRSGFVGRDSFMTSAKADRLLGWVHPAGDVA